MHSRVVQFTHTHTFFFRFFSLTGCYKILSVIPCVVQYTHTHTDTHRHTQTHTHTHTLLQNIECSSLCCAVQVLLLICFIYSNYIC